MPEVNRLPPFSDFSPGIVGDIRKPLKILKDAKGDAARIHEEFAKAFFGGKRNKRSTTNLPTSLQNSGLADGDLQLTSFGEQVLEADTATDAARIYARKMIVERNGNLLVEAVRNLSARTYIGDWKYGLKRELIRLGIDKETLSRATTDHTTLANWLVEAGVFTKKGRKRGYEVNEEGLKRTIGISSTEFGELLELSEPQRRFLYEVRAQAEKEGEFIPVSPLITALLTNYPELFREDQFRAEVGKPVENGGWIISSDLTEGRGAKSGSVTPTEKLLRVPIELVLEDFDVAIPSDLRVRLNTSRQEIADLLESDSKYDRGLGFELLTLHMLLDLSLQPKGFRKRSRETAYAEIDVLAEGAHLIFSRWTVQCKATPEARVDLSDIAKEVGIALHQKAHVVMVVTSGDFTADAEAYALQMSRDHYFQFLLINGNVIRKYLSAGRSALIKYVIANAERVMITKSSQRRERVD